MISAEETLGDLATAHPTATAVFLRHRLDFCCGGKSRLKDACQALGIDPEVVIAEIAAEGTTPEPQRWDIRPAAELIDFILTRYHEPLRRELPVLIDAAKKVERVHAEKESCPRGLAHHLETMAATLNQHMMKEEQVLFPALREGIRGQQLQMPVRVMMKEHDEHGASLRHMRELTTNFAPPPEACATWRAMYVALEKIEAELMQHIHLENNVLFPPALGN